VMKKVDAKGTGEPVGTITVSDSPDGMVIQPDIEALPPGPHGMHVHEKGSCEPGQDEDGKPLAAGASGEHYDPENTGRHRGPTGNGHAGDLPVLRVDSKGVADQPVTARRLKVGDIRERAIIVHEGSDNYSDEPEPLGGGGGRIACGTSMSEAEGQKR